MALRALADLFEEQANIYFHTDPDPLDDRHVLRKSNSSDFSTILHLISNHDSFINRLTEYLLSSDNPSNPTVRAAARLFCCIHAAVTLSVTVSEQDSTLEALYKLASSEVEPTNCYALFLLGSVMDNAELLYVTKQHNIELVSLVLKRLAIYSEALDREMAERPTDTDDKDFRKRLGYVCLEPLSTEGKIRLCMAYLTSLAEYQDMMPCLYDGGVLKHVYHFMEPKYSIRDIRITFEALRLLANLLCHRCIHLDFVESRGLELLMKVPKPSVASTAVSVVLYYTSYFEDAMERMCTLRKNQLEKIMSYALWLVECSHPSARCYALFFLNIALCYGAFFRLFTVRHGLRYLFNAMCVLPIRLTEDRTTVTKDAASWHVVRASLTTMRRYLDISLLAWIDSLDPQLGRIFDEPPKLALAADNRLVSYTTEQMTRLISMVISRMRPHISFPPIQDLDRLEGIPILFRVIARNVYAYDNWPGRNDCARLAVDILNIMSLSYNLAETIVAIDVYAFPEGRDFTRSRIRRRPRNFGEPNIFRLFLEEEEDAEEVDGVVSDGPSSEEADDAEQLDTPSAPENAEGAGQHSRISLPGSGIPFLPPNLHRGTAGSNSNLNALGGTYEATSAGRPNMLSGGVRRDEQDRINGLLMLISMIRDNDQGWDVNVQKAILSFIGNLVYRSIDDREHPDQPILASTVLSYVSEKPSILPDPNESALATSRNRTNTRKRRFEDSFANIDNDDLTGGPPHAKSFIVENADGTPCRRNKSANIAPLPELLHHQMRLWCAVRRQHGLMLLLHKLDVTQPVVEADSIRTLACRGLVGLARSEEVRSMLAKMPIFTKSQLQLLMKEPVLPDRMVEHAEFCRYASLLMHLVLGSSISESGGLTDDDLMSMDRVRRAIIVAGTRIQWDQEELLEIIWRHLQSKGLHKTASVLQQEAHLRLGSSSIPPQLPLFSHEADSDSEPPTMVPTAVASNADESPSTPPLRLNKFKPPMGSAISTPKSVRDRLERTPGYKQHLLQQSQPGLGGSNTLSTGPTTSGPVNTTLVNAESNEVTLSKIVESYLMHQHAQCPHPLSVCPRFSLRKPHRCPDREVDTVFEPVSSVAAFDMARQTFVGCCRMRCQPKRFLRRYIHSKFMPIFAVRDVDGDIFTSADFGRGSGVFGDDGLFLGTASGAVCWVNVEEMGPSIELLHEQSQSINGLEHTRDGRRLLVYSRWGDPPLALAHLNLRDNSETGNTTSASAPFVGSIGNLIFPGGFCRHAEFSRTGLQDMVVATYGKDAKIFDVTSGQCIIDLFSSSEYEANKATFSMDDRLVLNDGVVWDVRCRVTPTDPVHKIDKFQDVISGVFHPNGMEIIVSSAVWDMRTWRLLRTVQALDKFESFFSEKGDIIYAGCFEQQPESLIAGSSMQTIFRTVDALDYSLIASIDVKHPIDQLAIDRRDLRLAVVENFRDNNDHVGQCRVYSIGQKKSARELENEEDEEETNSSHRDDDDEIDAIFDSSSSRGRWSEVDDEDDSSQESSSESDGSSDGSESSWVTEEEMEVSSIPEENANSDRNDDGSS
ncbi:hypothetical protein Aperf_G00000020218 [Anoplocephala perfoliata]